MNQYEMDCEIFAIKIARCNSILIAKPINFL